VAEDLVQAATEEADLRAATTAWVEEEMDQEKKGGEAALAAARGRAAVRAAAARAAAARGSRSARRPRIGPLRVFAGRLGRC
jgi:hypothetical protein